MINESNLLVYNIQRYSVHDGPGIRSTIFLKGCPLRCLWCHNPESQTVGKTISIDKNKCIGCNLCIENCPSPNNCILCGKCVDICPANARTFIGKEYSVNDLMEVIESDRTFYEESSGGVTFSGGEPLMQAKLLVQLLKRLNKKDIHVAIDTSGYSNLENIKLLCPYVDLWLYDIKHLNDRMHKKLTGVSNRLILSNLKYLDDNGANIWIRYPFIPSCNNSDNDIKQLGAFVKKLNSNKVHLLAYHNLAEDKHNRFEMTYLLKNLAEPSNLELKKAKEILENYNINVKIGG